MRNIVKRNSQAILLLASLSVTCLTPLNAYADPLRQRAQNPHPSRNLAQLSKSGGGGFIEDLEHEFGLKNTLRERRSKTLELLGGADSSATPSVLAGGTGVIGYYYTPDLVIDVGLRMALGIRPFNFSNLFDGQAAYEGTAAIRYFMGRTLYGAFGGGIGLYEATHKETKSKEFTSWKESAMIWRPYVGIGNQWHWRTWTIQVEWIDIGYHVGLSPVKNTLTTTADGSRPETSEAASITKIPGSVYVGSKLLMGFAF
ncbi:MAG: hypothetical protein FJ146_11100 [Deltaproteobacteria bacterium]|nr:hypothetical protein [Deltaproteobacteria bacterium]